MGFDPHEPRDPKGRWTHGGGWASKLIRASDLSSGDARRSRAVSEAEFKRHYEQGAVKVAALKANASPPEAMQGPRFKRLTDEAYAATRKPWGGLTVDAHTGKHVADNADAYALTIRDPGMDPVIVSPSASREAFDNAMDEARKRFHEILSRPGSHLGVFYDDDLKRIDIDPVLVTPRLADVEDIGAYTRALGGAYHFKSGDGFWPPHVKDGPMGKKKTQDLSYVTPAFEGEFDLSTEDGKLAFWKQILPKKVIHYTAQDGTRKTLDFNDEYLTDLANNKAVDKIGFLLADKNNAHTMDPERWRGEVAQFEVREDGLYGKIVFPNKEAAKAVLDNPDLGVSARIREGIQRSDGSSLSRGIIHVLGTLDPQVSGMAGWQSADLSMSEADVLDLSNETFEEKAMAFDKTKPVTDYTEADIEAFSDEDLDEFLAALDVALDATLVEDEEPEAPVEDQTKEKQPVTANLSTEAQQQIDLANTRASEALRRMAEAQWRQEREAYLNEGVPPHLLDLAMPVLNRPDDFVVDLSNTDGDGAEVDVSKIVRGLLDAAKGTIDLSVEQGHGGTFRADDGEDPDKAMLDLWAEQG